MASCFLSSSEDEIRQLLEEKDLQYIIKQLSDSVFVICKIINVKIINASPSAWLITLTSTLIMPHITKTSSSNCLLCTDNE